ncbi:hypothetical protein V8B55DRAFT_1559299 [Mucor lusitanicus]|uniref:Uncharacterized protein n=1 Tax=Mucor lusitanicus CBS 277.49 TaxID=747725 RepID=A0A168JTX9_MUCCL|nr:hypothetical protein MUCCIDRAFT_165482 [Mucor lusitanicus CBS 277.49]
MVSRKRKRQEERYYTGMNVNRAPVISTRQRTHAVQPDQETVFRLLNTQMGARLRSKIYKCIKEDGSLIDLRTTCNAMTQLERGIVSEAEAAGNFPTRTIANFLNKHNKANETTNIDLWKEYIVNHFDAIVVQENARIAAETQEAGEKEVEEADVTATAPLQQEMRSCIVPLSTVIRQDLPDALKRTFIQRLSATIAQATDYTTAYGFQLYRLMILFKDHTFEVGANNSVMIQEHQGFQCGNILPDWFPLDDEQVFVAPPLQAQVQQLDGFKNQYKKLFNDAYLDLQKKREYTEQKKQARSQEPRRATPPVSDSIQGIPADRISVIHLSRDQKRNLFDKERKNHTKYSNKAELHQDDPNFERKYQQWADRSLMRIDTYKRVLQTETITEAHLKAYCKDLTGAEMAPCLLICNMIMPYVPAKSDWFSLPYQLPFVLMANELLRLTDYSRRIVSKEDATSNKDAIFSSFFDIGQLQGTCNSYGLIFAQSLVMYPGVKTVALRGFMQKHPVIASSDPSPKQAKPTPA